MLFSSFAAAFVYKIGAKFVNRTVAIGSSLLYTCSNFIIMEAHDARAYSLLVMLTAASMYFFFSLIEAKNRMKYLIALTLTNILLIYTHFLGFFIIMLQAIYTLTFKDVRKNIFKKYLISSILLILAFIPYLYFFIVRINQVLQSGIHTPETKISHLYSSLFIFSNGQFMTILFISILLGFIIYTVVIRQKISVYEKMILGWFFLLYLIVFVVSLKVSITAIPKYLIFIFPGFFLSLSVAINHFTKISRIAGICLIVTCIALMALKLDIKASQGFEAKKTVSLIQNHKSDSTIVFIFPRFVDIVFTYHYNINAFKDYRNYNQYLNKDNIFVLSSANDIDTARLNRASDVILLDGWNLMSYMDPKQTIVGNISSKFANVETLASLYGYSVYHFRP